jgi:hypothetical protein
MMLFVIVAYDESLESYPLLQHRYHGKRQAVFA